MDSNYTRTDFQDGPTPEVDRKKSNWRLFSHAGACWRLVVDVGTGRPRDPSRGSRAALPQLRKAEEFSRGAESSAQACGRGAGA